MLAVVTATFPKDQNVKGVPLMTNYVFAGAARYSGRGYNHGGLFRLAVGGETWESLGDGLPERAEVRAVAINPEDPAIVYAGTQYGPYRSQDAGDCWEALPFPDGDRVVWSFLFEPGNSKVLYAGTAPSAVYRTEDGGKRWDRLPIVEPRGVVEMGFPTRVVRLVGTPLQPGTLYAAVEVGGVIRSDDFGASWEDCTGDLLRLSAQDHLKSAIGSDLEFEGMADAHALAVSIVGKQKVFLATRMGLFTSDDRGHSWEELGIVRFSPLTYARDVKVSSHDPNTLFVALSESSRGDAGSLYVSRDAGTSWQRFDHGVELTSTLMVIAESSTDLGRLFGGGRSGQVIGTTDGGGSWVEYGMPVGVEDLYALACH